MRYAWVMRSFLILSGHYKEVALSLDDEGQLLARLSWKGFVPDSSDPEVPRPTTWPTNLFNLIGRQNIKIPGFELCKRP